MNIHPQFTFCDFLILLFILLAINILILKFKNKSIKDLVNWKVIFVVNRGYSIGITSFRNQDFGNGRFKNLWISQRFCGKLESGSRRFRLCRIEVQVLQFFSECHHFFSFYSLFFNTKFITKNLNATPNSRDKKA